jgi:hypothetical protein
MRHIQTAGSVLGFLTDLTKVSAMDTRQEFELLEKALFSESAKIDAIAAVVSGMLEAAKGNPAVAKAVSDKLEQDYAAHIAKPQYAQNPYYRQSFEVMRDYLRKMIE